MKTEKQIKQETAIEILEIINRTVTRNEGIRQALNILIKMDYDLFDTDHPTEKGGEQE